VRWLRRHPGEWDVHALVRVRRYAAFFAVNANLLVRTLALMFTMSFVTAMGARLGPLVLAANAVLMQFQNLTSFGLDGVANAAEALVGRYLGANRRDALERSVALSLKWSLIFAAAFAVAYLLGGKALIRVMTDLGDVRATAYAYLPWMIVSPVVSVWSFLYDGVFVGATRAKDMRNIMLVSSFAVFLPAWFVLQPLGNHGLWAAFMLWLAARGLGMHVLYRRHILALV
jgi:MATE family multidrug resistance protein